jgi:hypothetical protein
MSEKEGGVRKRTLNKSGMRNVHSQGKTGNYSGKVGNGHVFPIAWQSTGDQRVSLSLLMTTS